MKLIRRRKGVESVVAEDSVEVTKSRKVTRRVTAAEKADWAAPERKNLTKSQWQEWGDALRKLRLYDFINAESLSLNEMRDVLKSIKFCTMNRVVHGEQYV